MHEDFRRIQFITCPKTGSVLVIEHKRFGLLSCAPFYMKIHIDTVLLSQRGRLEYPLFCVHAQFCFEFSLFSDVPLGDRRWRQNILCYFPRYAFSLGGTL